MTRSNPFAHSTHLQGIIFATALGTAVADALAVAPESLVSTDFMRDVSRWIWLAIANFHCQHNTSDEAHHA